MVDDRNYADYEQMAIGFDAVLPHIVPVAEAILQGLPDALQGTVVDIGCGTGEPGLTLARRRPDLKIVGVDPATAMIGIARRKAADLPNVAFVEGSAEDTQLPDATAAAVVSRFGLLAFGDPHRSVAELLRILAPGGTYSLASWHDIRLNTLPYLTYKALREHLPADQLPPFGDPEEFAETQRHHVQVLRDAGLDPHVEDLRWAYHFSDFDAVTRFVTGPGVLGQPFDALNPAAAREVRSRLADLLTQYRGPDSAFHIPQTCRLVRGDR